jgi:hypothetical protein
MSGMYEEQYSGLAGSAKSRDQQNLDFTSIS